MLWNIFVSRTHRHLNVQLVDSFLLWSLDYVSARHFYTFDSTTGSPYFHESLYKKGQQFLLDPTKESTTRHILNRIRNSVVRSKREACLVWNQKVPDFIGGSLRPWSSFVLKGLSEIYMEIAGRRRLLQTLQKTLERNDFLGEGYSPKRN